jgi:hypothetical protein
LWRMVYLFCFSILYHRNWSSVWEGKRDNAGLVYLLSVCSVRYGAMRVVTTDPDTHMILLKETLRAKEYMHDVTIG